MPDRAKICFKVNYLCNFHPQRRSPMKYPIFLLPIIILLVCCLLPTASAATIDGLIYHDGDRSSQSHYLQSFDELDTPLAEVPVSLLGAAKTRQTTTDEQGKFTFSDIDPGYYFLDIRPGDFDSTSNNHSRRSPEAIAEGHLNIVSLGDSIGVFPPENPYPDRLTEHFSELTQVALNNIHVGGSRSWEWLPGDEKAYFENRLLPLLPDADLVTITITGNDLDIYIEGLEPPYDMGEVLLNFFSHPEYMFEAFDRLTILLESIKEINDWCDVVFILYPNFANSSYIERYTGEALQPIIAWLVSWAVSLERDQAGLIDHIVLTDMHSYYRDAWLDDFLIDEVHPSAAGAQDYADQIFLALGGVIVKDEGSVPTRLVGFYDPELNEEVSDDDFGDDDLPAPGDDEDDDQSEQDDLPAESGGGDSCGN